MTNHVHLLISSDNPEAVGALMKALGQRYVQYVNKIMYRRSGTLWEGRYKSCTTQAETYLLACQRYIELNPVRADMVNRPAEYKWSSYAFNAQGDASLIIKPHELYIALGLDDTSRQAAYRELFRYLLDIGVVDEIRKATNGNYVLAILSFPSRLLRLWVGELQRGRRADRKLLLFNQNNAIGYELT